MKTPAFLNIVLQPCGSLCNLQCDYCYVHSANKSAAAFTATNGVSHPGALEAGNFFLEWFPLMLKGLKHMEGLRFVRFTWHGGEPLLLPETFYRKALSMQEKLLQREGLRWDNVMMTNGILLDEKVACFLKDLGIYIGISCDGPSWEHNRPRFSNEKEFKAVFKAFEHLHQQQVEYSIVVVVHRYNKDAAAEIFDMLCRLNPASGISLTPCFNAKESISCEEYGDFLIRLYDLWQPSRPNRIALFDNVERGLNYEVPIFCQLVGKRCRSFLTATYDGILWTGCQVPFLQEEDPHYGRVGSIREEDWPGLMEHHWLCSHNLEESLTNREIYKMLDEETPFLYFQGKGCPNRRQSDSRQDPYAPAFARLIAHVYHSGQTGFDNTTRRKIDILLMDQKNG